MHQLLSNRVLYTVIELVAKNLVQFHFILARMHQLLSSRVLYKAKDLVQFHFVLVIMHQLFSDKVLYRTCSKKLGAILFKRGNIAPTFQRQSYLIPLESLLQKTWCNFILYCTNASTFKQQSSLSVIEFKAKDLVQFYLNAVTLHQLLATKFFYSVSVFDAK